MSLNINNNMSLKTGSSYFNDWRRRWRYICTGHESKRIRDHLKDKIKDKNPPTIKLLDKITFTLGVLNISFVQYFLFVKPAYFWLWYSIVIPLLMITRFFHFKSLGWHYFMLGMLINHIIPLSNHHHRHHHHHRLLLLCIDAHTLSTVYIAIISNTI